jgi:hypothetical protein
VLVRSPTRCFFFHARMPEEKVAVSLELQLNIKFTNLLFMDSKTENLNPNPKARPLHTWDLSGKVAGLCECMERGASLTLTSFVNFKILKIIFNSLSDVDSSLVLSSVVDNLFLSTRTPRQQLAGGHTP